MKAELTAEELFHLGMHASDQGDNEKAITLLKRLADSHPDHLEGKYMLGAIYAEIGMFDHAKQSMNESIEDGLNIPTAHFQLGLLHATSGDVESAMNAWAPLSTLAEEDALFQFQRGITHLLKDEFQDAIQRLEHGIANNTINEALNDDMRGIVDAISKSIDKSDSKDLVEGESQAIGKSLFISAYQKRQYDEE